ncbi:MAG: hypothetical protein Q9159_006706 [Coniocarpon cinnabarinum]
MRARPLPEREPSTSDSVYFTPREQSDASFPAPQPLSPPPLTNDEAKKAAVLIQRNYRGYRERRELAGLSTNAVSRRWSDAVNEAQWRLLNTPRPRAERAAAHTSPNSTLSTDARRRASAREGTRSTFAHSEWKRLLQVARRADNDDTASEDEMDPSWSEAQQESFRQKRKAEKSKREEYARTMGLEYFLEMVDEKHRYGSHLRAYHAVWQQADTNENFFYWLDYGDGTEVEVMSCSRDVLERDQVRYLNREERARYLVKVDGEGRLRWAKNNEKITTSYEFKDSLEGVVPASDTTTPVFRESVHGRRHPQQDPDSVNAVDHERRRSPSSVGRPTSSLSSNSGSSKSVDSVAEGQHYVNQELEQTHGIKKVKYVSAGALLNHLLQKTTRKNTWIFVADTSFRLYIGIKQSGAFQHSSFLQGSRVAAAGLIKVKDGQLRRLSPLSGHYRPPTRNFRAFVHSMNEAKVDMSRVSISRSYAVLLGLEGYMKTKKQVKEGLTNMQHKAEEVLDPESAREREERTKDKSESARKEKEFLEKQRTSEEARRHESGFVGRFKELGRKMRKSEPSTPVVDTTNVGTSPVSSKQK